MGNSFKLGRNTHIQKRNNVDISAFFQSAPRRQIPRAFACDTTIHHTIIIMTAGLIL